MMGENSKLQVLPPVSKEDHSSRREFPPLVYESFEDSQMRATLIKAKHLLPKGDLPLKQEFVVPFEQIHIVLSQSDLTCSCIHSSSRHIYNTYRAVFKALNKILLSIQKY